MREPTAADDPVRIAGTTVFEAFGAASYWLTSVTTDPRLRNAAKTAAKLAERSLRLEPNSPPPLADSTARRKLTQPIESRMPVSIKSVFSSGIGTDKPASR
jgi:hypothetical protein